MPVNENPKFPVGRLISGGNADTSYYLSSQVGGYAGSSTRQQSCVDIWLPGLWRDAAHALRRTLNNEHAATRSAVLIINGERHDALQVEDGLKRLFATGIEGGWLVVVTVPDGDATPEIEILPGEKTVADGKPGIGLPAGLKPSPAPPVELDMPVAFLAGYERRPQPEHTDPLARVGVTAARYAEIDGRLRRAENRVRHAVDAQAAVMRRSDLQEALFQLLEQVLFDREHSYSHASQGTVFEAEGPENRVYPGFLTVEGVQHEALELREPGVVLRAAVVDGWTVVASVPDGQEPVVELVYADSEASG